MKGSERKILAELKLEDLREPHRMIAEVVGIDGLLKLCNNFGGSSIYIPQKRDLLKNKIYAAIYHEFDGSNIKQLAVKYDVSEATVYNIIRDKITKGGNIPGQLTFASTNMEIV